MYKLWLAHSTKDKRSITRDALLSVDSKAVMEYISDPAELRQRAKQELTHLSGVILGPTTSGISDENLVAALSKDGVEHIILAVDSPSGSTRSRAKQAGCELVIDTSELTWTAFTKTDTSKSSIPSVVGKCPVEVRASKQEDDLEKRSTNVLPQVNYANAVEIKREAHEMEDLAPLLVFASGRGGVGKTTLACSTAALCASWGMHVALVDLDLSCGNAFSYLGISQPIDLSRILADGNPSSESLGRSSTRAKCGVNLWGPTDKPEAAEVIYPHVKTLLNYVRSCFDVVIVDTSTTFTDAVAEAAQACSKLYLVHDAMAGGIASVVRTNSLALRLGVARTRVVRLENGAYVTHKRRDLELGNEISLDGMNSATVYDGGIEVSEFLGAGTIEELLLLDNPMILSLSKLIAKSLSELGALPDSEAAKRALEEKKSKSFSIFKKKVKA